MVDICVCKHTKQETTITELPRDVVRQVLTFLDHPTLHAVEMTSLVFYELIEEAHMWERLAGMQVVCSDTKNRLPHEWKRITCLSSRPCQEDKKLVRGIRAYSSEDRQSENPNNTLSQSKCWSGIQRFQDSPALYSPHELQDMASFGMSLGERIQMQCGCSTGNSCYWSSSASTDKNAADFIDYAINGPCVVSCVQILPYRVFWHPGSPTYAPQRVSFAFYEQGELFAGTETPVVATDSSSPTPFYQSPAFDVENDMKMQEFHLPKKVMATETTVLRIHLIGRHQAQTFELPRWLQRTEEDRLPKYYCCLSFVNVLGLPCTVVEPTDPFARAMQMKEQSLRLAASFTEYMASCYEGFMEQRRRGQ